MTPPEFDTSATTSAAPLPAPPAPPAAATAAAASGGGGVEHVLAGLATELLRQRSAERKWRIFFRLAWLGLALAVAWVLWAGNLSPGASQTTHTALVDVRGEIGAETEASAELLVASLKSAFADEHAQAVVLRFNSPGGSPVQAGIVHDEILRLKALHGKKVYAVVEDTCASGAYYMAVATDAIYVDKASVVGSIGVLMDGFGFTGIMDKLGIERRLLTAGSNKAMLDPFSPVSAQQLKLTQAMLDQIHAQFIAVVRKGRGARLKETPETFSGLFWNGEEAVRQGLADQLGNLDYVAREVVKAEDVIDYTTRENVAERLARRFGAGVGAGAVRVLRELAPLR